MTRQVSITLTDEEIKSLPEEAQKGDELLQTFIHQSISKHLKPQSTGKADEEIGPRCRVYQVSEEMYAYEISDEDFANLQAYADDTNHTPEEIFQFWVQGKIDYLAVSEDFLKEQKRRREQEKNRSLPKAPKSKKSKRAYKKRAKKEVKV